MKVRQLFSFILPPSSFILLYLLPTLSPLQALGQAGHLAAGRGVVVRVAVALAVALPLHQGRDGVAQVQRDGLARRLRRVFGGLLPLIGLSVVAQTGNIYAGLYYPIVVASVTFVVGSLLLRETRHVLIWDEVEKHKD